jgi:hypothetical protein
MKQSNILTGVLILVILIMMPKDVKKTVLDIEMYNT